MTAADLLSGRLNQPGTASSSTNVGGGSTSSRHNARISTGSAALDGLLGGGGVACGTVTEFCEYHAVMKWQHCRWLTGQVPSRPAISRKLLAFAADLKVRTNLLFYLRRRALISTYRRGLFYNQSMDLHVALLCSLNLTGTKG